MHGQGTLRWASGERYDGEWVEGEEHGLGVFTWRDGTTYDGFWQSGKKHGIGVRHATCDVRDTAVWLTAKAAAPLALHYMHACGVLLAAVSVGFLVFARRPWS